MTKRVKHVTMMSRPGATDSTVMTAMSWTMRPAAVGVARRDERLQARHLRRRLGAASEQEQQSDDEELVHSTTSDWMTSSRTLPPLRTRTRSLRSSRRCWKPLGAFDLRERHGAQEGDDVLGDLRRQHVGVRRSARPSTTSDASSRIQVSLGLGEIGDDRRERLQVDVAGIAALLRPASAASACGGFAVDGCSHPPSSCRPNRPPPPTAEHGQRPASPR